MGDNVIRTSDGGSYIGRRGSARTALFLQRGLTEIAWGDMGFARLYRRCVFALIAIGLMAGPAVAQLDLPAPPKASLLDLTLSPGGSNDPPGDRLVAVVLIYPGTDRVDLDLGAEAVDETAGPLSPAPGSIQVPDGKVPKAPRLPVRFSPRTRPIARRTAGSD